ncbi:uncharacterized protein LOC135209986 [Macrobrachium nipponense]|uniref:uncharacterized protein LOC135209986 n=1 Tax=Macrobrachium nipponense TaxID=159736 RepID=UPI0030C8AE0B
MPPQKPVHKLKLFARDKVLYNVCAVILNEIFFGQEEDWDVYGPPRLSVRLELVREILIDSLTPGIMEELLNTILARDEEVEAIVRYLALQLLLNPGVRNLSIGNFPETYYSMVLEVISKNGTGIHQLDLRGIWIGTDHRNALLRVLRRLDDIRRLTLRYNCDDEMLSTIGKYCNRLQKIDVSGSRNITEEGLRKLCSNPSRVCIDLLKHSLQIVDLGGPGAQSLPPSHVKYLFVTLPNLVSVGSYECTGQAVELFYNTYPGRKLGLLYMHDLTTTSARLSCIAKTCPNLQAIYFDSPKGTVVQYLDMLKKVNELKLHKVRWTDVEILLPKMGPNIRSLYLLTVFGDVNLADLGSWCTDLRRLEFHNVSLVSLDSTKDSAFEKVVEFLVYSSQMSVMSVRLIFNQCKAVERLSLGDCGQLSDAAVTSSLIDGSLCKIKELWLGVAVGLTISTIQSLIEHCPMLTDVGNIANWNVHSDDIDLLRVQLLISNTDLTLHELATENDDEWIAIG